MSIYRFSSNSPVRDITFRYANDRPPVALLSAGTAGPEELVVIRRALESAGWSSVPLSAEDRDVLQVTGFKDEGQLAAFLQLNHFAGGMPQVVPEPGDHPTRSAGDWLQDHSLKAAGLLNMVGDIGFLGSGLMSGRNKEITAGLLYTAGAGVLTRYGNAKTEHHLRRVAENTAKFLQQQACELPEDCGLSTLLKQRRNGVLHNAENFLYRYPSEVMLGAYTLGAVSMLQSGLKQGNPWDVAYGTSSVAVKVASLLIPEKHATEEEKKAAGPIGRFIHWVQEKPLRVMGFGSLVTDTLLGLSALREYRNAPKQRSYMFKFLTTGTYIMADVLMAISNKNHANADGKFDQEEQRRLEALVAESIVRQPSPMRDALVYQVAGFLATQPEINGNAMQIGDSVREQVARLQQNPWACRTAPGLSQPPLRL